MCSVFKIGLQYLVLADFAAHRDRYGKNASSLPLQTKESRKNEVQQVTIDKSINKSQFNKQTVCN